MGFPPVDAKLLCVTYMYHRFRIGASYSEADWFLTFVRGIPGFVPVHVGFTLYSRPRKTLFFYSMRPRVYVEASGSAWGRGAGPYLRGAVCAAVESHGIGLALETGVKTWGYLSTSRRAPGQRCFLAYPYASLGVRLLTFSIGF